VTLSDLAKYSMTRSVARSLCDSWASCWRRCCVESWKCTVKLSLSTGL